MLSVTYQPFMLLLYWVPLMLCIIDAECHISALYVIVMLSATCADYH
jgi:hypothetical protein